MAHRQVFPSSLFPLRGDVSAEAGATTVRVIGLQGVPISPASPGSQDVFIYNSVTNTYEPTSIFAIEIEGHGMSLDKLIYINGVPDGAPSPWGIDINSTPDGG